MGEPHWLTEEEDRAWRGWLAMRRVIERGLDRQLEHDAGLSAADYALLVPLSESPGGALRARDLGRSVDWERSRLSHQLQRMERRGLVARTDCPTDARGTVIVLTVAGREAIEAAAPAHVEWVRQHFVGLLTPYELDTLRSISTRVVESLCEAAAGAECAEPECGEAALDPCDAELDGQVAE